MEFDNPLYILCNDVIYCTSDTIIHLIYKYLSNISQDPLNMKYRTIKLHNKTFSSIWEYLECQELFTKIGFEINEEKLSITLSQDKSLKDLNDCLQYFDEFFKQCKEKEQNNLMTPSLKTDVPLPTGLSIPQQTELHFAAMKGDIDGIRSLIVGHPEWINAKDENQWQPLHEAARKGCVESIQLLLSHGLRYLLTLITLEGADPEARTSNGGNALWWAEEYHPSNHPCIFLLKQHTQDPSLSSIPLPPHTSRQSLPHKYCQVCWKEVFHYSTSHAYYIKYNNRFLTRAPHPRVAIQCKTCKQLSEELLIRERNTVEESVKSVLQSQIQDLMYIICGECYNFQRGDHDSTHSYEIFYSELNS